MSETIEERDGWRVRLEVDTDAQAPDWDGQGYVYRIPSFNVDRIMVEHRDYGAPDAPDLSDILREHGSVADIADAVAQLPDVVSVDHISTRGWQDDAFLFVVTRERAESFGCPESDWDKLAGQAREAWTQWILGDVYGAIVERQDVWTNQNGDTRTTWDERDSCWGFYGYRYAVEEAKRMLADAMPSADA